MIILCSMKSVNSPVSAVILVRLGVHSIAHINEVYIHQAELML